MTARRTATLGRVVASQVWEKTKEELRAQCRLAHVTASTAAELMEAARKLQATEAVIETLECEAREPAPPGITGVV